jgi:hypothetical protein
MLREQGQYDESLRIFREAVRQQGVALGLKPKDPVFRELRCKHQAQIADTFLQMSRAADAADAARELPRLAPDDTAALLRAASLFASCAAMAQRNRDIAWGLGQVLTRVYQREAVAVARRAIEKGLANPARVLSDPVFDPVRDCDEFRLLLHEVTTPKD